MWCDVLSTTSCKFGHRSSLKIHTTHNTQAKVAELLCTAFSSHLQAPRLLHTRTMASLHLPHSHDGCCLPAAGLLARHTPRLYTLAHNAMTQRYIHCAHTQCATRNRWWLVPTNSPHVMLLPACVSITKSSLSEFVPASTTHTTTVTLRQKTMRTHPHTHPTQQHQQHQQQHEEAHFNHHLSKQQSPACAPQQQLPRDTVPGCAEPAAAPSVAVPCPATVCLHAGWLPGWLRPLLLSVLS